MCTKQLDQLKYFNTKIQELTSNFVRLLKKKKTIFPTRAQYTRDSKGIFP